MSNNISIKIDNVSKIYKLYDKPIDKVKEALSLSRKKDMRNSMRCVI